jgi:hypothetical protein
MLFSKARERDLVGNKVPNNMIGAGKKLDMLNNTTIREAETWDW